MRPLWSLILLTAMFALSSRAQASVAPNYARGGEIVNVQSEGLSFSEQYFPFSLSPNLHPEVSEAKVLTWVGSCLLGGLGAWLGSIISLNNQPQHSDALAAGVIHFAFEIITSSSVILSPLSCIDVWYFAPIAVLNAWDRAYKGAGNKRKDVRGLDSPPELTMAY